MLTRKGKAKSGAEGGHDPLNATGGCVDHASFAGGANLEHGSSYLILVTISMTLLSEPD